MKSAWLDRGIDHGIPVGVQPAGCSAAKSGLHKSTSVDSLFIRLLFYRDSLAAVNSFFFDSSFRKRNIWRNHVVFWTYPRYDSGRTHPYHPKRARFFIPP